MFCVAAVYLLLGASAAFALCDVKPSSMKGDAWRHEEVKRVLDGDTLELVGGGRVRIVGVNAPETAKYGKPGDPLGKEAWKRLQMLAKVGEPLYFRKDKTPKDRYGRLLLHPFFADGRNLTAELLREGLGFHVVLPPNDWQSDCYRQQEREALGNHVGVWGLAHYQAVASNEIASLHGGYSLVKGRVESVVLTRATAWIELQGHVSVKVAKKDLDTVEGTVWRRLVAAAQNHQVENLPLLEVRGWVSDRREWDENMRDQIAKGERKPFQFNVRHRYDWSLLDSIQSP